MTGATMTTTPLRRRKGKPEEISVLEIHGSPTDERLRRADADYQLGGEDRGVKTYVMRDTPLDRALKKKIITGAEHSALQKYRHHWYHAGQAPYIGSIDLNRIHAGSDGGPAGMPKSEGQVFHRQRWREAQETLGMRSAAIVDRFVCDELSLEDCGYSILGFSNKPQAIAGAQTIISDAGFRLAKLWGIG